MSYHVFVYNGSEPRNVAKVFSNVDSVIDFFCSIIQSKFNCFETNYKVAFLRCLCELSNIERKEIIRKHKSTSEIAANWKKEERNLHFNGPREKIRTLRSTGLWTHRKKQTLSNKDEKYRSMNSHDKEQLLSNRFL